MFGALDVGLFIIRSEDHARKLTIHSDMRDLAAPDDFVVTLQGVATGQHGGFTYRDELRLVRRGCRPGRELKKAKPRDVSGFRDRSRVAVRPRVRSSRTSTSTTKDCGTAAIG